MENLDKVADHIINKKKIPPTPWSKIIESAQNASELAPVSDDNLITAMYTQLPPARDDYGNVRITATDMDDGNFYNTATKKLHLNDYKTSGKYGHQIIALPKSLTTLIQKSLIATPRSYLFTKLDKSKPFGKMSTFVSKVFAKYSTLPASKLGINNLRHSRISHEYAKDDFNTANKKKLARQMYHSSDVAQEMYLHTSVVTGED